MIYLMLYLVFAKIAFFAFGGGFANLPIIQSELLSRGWCTAAQFADIVAIAQITP
ncbi:MAG: chromate transporter, partial [Spirochaetia bacterium]|nr:chromate transporter [Spirochaetia bacterium]